MRVSWISDIELPGWNISYYYLTYFAQIPGRNRPENSFQETVGVSESLMDLAVDKLLVRPEVEHVFEMRAVLKLENLEGIGEVKGEKATKNITLKYGKKCKRKYSNAAMNGFN